MARPKPKYKSKDPFLFTCSICGAKEMLTGYSAKRVMCKDCRKIVNCENGIKRAAEILKSQIYTFACGCKYTRSQLPNLEGKKKSKCPEHGKHIVDIERHCSKCDKLFSCRGRLTVTSCPDCRRSYNPSNKPRKISNISYEYKPEPKYFRKPDCKYYAYCLDKSIERHEKGFCCQDCIRYESKPLRVEDYTWAADSMQTTGLHAASRPI